MTPADLLVLAWSQWRAATVRSILTTLGVAIGVAAFTTLFALGRGLQDNFRERLLRGGFLQAVTVLPFQEGEDGAQRRLPLDEKALARFRALPGVHRVDRDIRLPVKVKAPEGKGRATGIAVAMPVDAREEALFDERVAGGYFSGEQAPEIIVTAPVARGLGWEPAAAIGRTVKVAPGGAFMDRVLQVASPFGLFSGGGSLARDLRIVGVVARERVGFGSLGASLFLPYGTARALEQALLGRMPGASRLGTSYSASIRLTDAGALAPVEKAVAKAGYRTISFASVLERSRSLFLLVDGLLVLMGGVALLVASLGIANTMITSVLERTREIGLLKALGARDRDVMGLFLAESALHGVVGGALGLLLSLGTAQLVGAVADAWFRRMGGDIQKVFSFPPGLLVAALALATGMCLLAALYPAQRAMRLDPTRALRHD
ncbi:MAG: ABC transporter permease [Candidatus Sericytochromatia bacterium]|nr:ABC transporter permease [Candidatus Sericytochromatia bacterium]